MSPLGTVEGPAGVISYTLAESGFVSLNVYDASGGIVRELKHREWQAAGDHAVYWDGKDGSGALVPGGSPFTWKLLSNPGTLKAEYVMSLGSNYVRGDGPAYLAPGTHQTPGAVAIDGSGMYIAAKETENIETTVLKQPVDGSARTWTALVPRAWDGAQALASANGTLFMLGYYGSATHLPTDNPLRAQWIYKYRPASPTGTAQYANGFAANGNGAAAEPAENHIDVSWDNPTLYTADATDMDAEGVDLVVAYAGKNAIRWYDQATGAVTATVTVGAPAGVTVAADGAAYVSSGTRILRVTKDGSRSVLVHGLSRPGLLDIDHGNNTILVHESRRNQVKRFSLADGSSIKTYGRAGGRLAGPYDDVAKTSFTHVRDLTSDQQGGFFVAEQNAAPRRVAHFNADGALVREWYGGQKWSPAAMVDPDDPRSVWMHSDAQDVLGNGFDFMRLSVDYAGKTWTVDSIYQYLGLASGLVTWGDNASADGYEIIKHEGKTFIAKLGQTFTVLMVDDVQTRLQPVTVCGNVDSVPANTVAAALIQANAVGNLSYQWNDANGDGDIQAAELQYFPAKTMVSIIPNVDGNGDYYGLVLDPSNANAPATMKKFVASWSGNVPFYSSFPAGQSVFNTPPRMRAPWDGRWSAFTYHDRSNDDDTVYVGLNSQAHGNMGECLDPFLYKWNSGSAGSWQVGGKAPASGAPPPSTIRGGFRRFAGMIRRDLASPTGAKVNSVVLQDYQGAAYGLTQTTALTYVWDQDGLWVGGVFDSVDGAAPWHMYLGGGEFLHGQLHDVPGSSDVYYYGNWENETRVWRISGWDRWSKQAGDVTAPEAIPAPAITVSYGATDVPDGDTTPSDVEGTDLGSSPIGSASAERTFTIHNIGSADLNFTATPPVATRGTHSGDFVISVQPATNIPPGGSTTFTVRFIPTAAGDRGGTDPNQSMLVINNDNNDAAGSTTPFTFALTGTGVASDGVASWVTATIPGAARTDAVFAGMSFRVGAQPIAVTALGRWILPGNQLGHVVALIDGATGQAVPGGTVTVQTAGATPDQYGYASLPSPITLAANHSYYIASREGAGDAWCDHNATELTTTSVASATGAVNGNPNRADGLWTNFAHQAFGPLSFQYRAASLVGWWRFDESAGGVAADSSGGGRDGAVTGGDWRPAGGHIGGALSCDGTSTVVTLPDGIVENAGYSTMTFACWVKTSAAGVLMGYQNVPYPQTASGYTPLLYIGLDGKARASVWPSGSLTSAASVNDDGWHHLALVVGDSSQTLYVDGQPVASNGSGIARVGETSNQIGAGYNNSASGWESLSTTTGWIHYNGLIDDARFYSAALSAAEIAALAAM